MGEKAANDMFSLYKNLIVNQFLVFPSLLLEWTFVLIARFLDDRILLPFISS